MKRRHLLAVGGATGVLLALGGGALSWWRPARTDGRFSADARQMLARLAEAVLDDALPAEPVDLATASKAHVDRVQATVAGLPPALQREVDQLFTLLLSPPGRQLLMGLSPAWPEATRADLQQALQGMRTSRLSLRQQVYHALRDLSNAAYFAAPATWALLGYPGPRTV